MRNLLLVERTGWTYEYVKNLDPMLRRYIDETYDAIDMARSYIRKRASGFNGAEDSSRPPGFN